MIPSNSPSKKTIVVIGNGMVGHRFCERLVEFDRDRQYQIVTFCEEPRAAYDRVGLTQFFAHRDAQKLMLANLDWYRRQGIELHLGDRATQIDRQRQLVRSQKGAEIRYDYVVLATGSYPFVPQVPGIEKRGIFVYRTIDDLERIIAYGQRVQKAAVIGGGLLGLEAAKAVYDLGLETHVIEYNGRLMPRQIDDPGSRILVKRIASLGVQVHLNRSTQEILGNGKVEGIRFTSGETLETQLVIISAGIRPRDELGRECNLEVGPRGGIAVNDQLQTSDPNIFAIGEVALHNNQVYGLVAPGYEMAEVLAANLTGSDRRYSGSDLSTKLKLMGVDVASFGRHEADDVDAQPISYEDPLTGIYKKLLVSQDGQRLLGGILVGDASDYGNLLMLYKSDKPLPVPPSNLLLGESKSATPAGLGELDDSAQICSCNNVTKHAISKAIRCGEAATLGDLKACTRAGTGCGGCLPLVTDLLQAELQAAGRSVNKSLCEHFAYTRQELYEIAKIKGIRTFDDLIASHGTGNGCETCRPAVASILASLWNEHVLEHVAVQDTNDRFLANLQRGGVYSVVPRVPGGEITPDKLIVLGQVAKKYNLYTKITGGQRVDLFGAPAHQLPEIWEELIDAGFESGHAYGKALRTVKSCVGSTWCRYGVQDSVGFAIRIENRYKGIRAPHKIKAAVSGCIRECAEAQSKDFGLIATDKGYNLYIGGNGGAKPKHAVLLAADLDEETAIRYIDRFLMYYIQTADKLTRTATWLEKLDGGIDYLREVIIEDRLGIAEDLERQMAFLVGSYRCEWKEVVESPEKRRLFRQFINTDETESCVEMVSEREQQRPADWPKEFVSLEQLENQRPAALPELTTDDVERSWVQVGVADDFPHDGGSCVKYGNAQIAVYHFASRGQWYATQNMCPHKQEMVLSRGLLGDAGGVPKVACPLHKKLFSLGSGKCLSGEPYSIQTFPVKVHDGHVYLLLPPVEQLDPQLSRQSWSCEAASATCEPQLA